MDFRMDNGTILTVPDCTWREKKVNGVSVHTNRKWAHQQLYRSAWRYWIAHWIDEGSTHPHPAEPWGEYVSELRAVQWLQKNGSVIPADLKSAMGRY